MLPGGPGEASQGAREEPLCQGIGVHKHEGNCEMIYVLSGCGTLLERDSEGLETMSYVTSGDCLYCPEGHIHSLMNTSCDEDLVFFAVVPKQ